MVSPPFTQQPVVQAELLFFLHEETANCILQLLREQQDFQTVGCYL